MQLSFERDLNYKQPIITLCTYESSYGLLSYSTPWLVPSLHVSTSPSSLRTPTSQILEVSAHSSPILWKYFKFSFVWVHGFHLWPWVLGGIIVFITMSSSSLHFFLIQMLSTTQQPHWAHFSLQYYSFCLPSPDGWFGSLNASVILLNTLTIWNIAKSNSILFYLSRVCVSYMYILGQVCVRARVSIKILFSITLHLGLLGFFTKNFWWKYSDIFYSIPCLLHPTSHMCLPHSLKLVTFLWSLSSGLLSHLHTRAHPHTNEKSPSSQKPRKNPVPPLCSQAQASTGHSVEDRRTHPLTPLILNTFKLHQSRKNAIMHPNGLWSTLTITSTMATRFHVPPPLWVCWRWRLEPKPGLMITTCSSPDLVSLSLCLLG